MSGLEALGIAASIIQVADLGTKLSVQLFSLYRRFKSANDSIQLLSNEVALVSAILHELGDNLKEEESSKLCSDEAFRTLDLVLNQCRDVLGQIQRMVENNEPGRGRFQQVTGKIRIVLLEPNLEQLKVTLGRLKSTMLLLLNVIMYAGQIRSNNVPTLVKEQRDLMQKLLEERQIGDRKPRQPDTAMDSSRGLSTETTDSGLAHASTDETSDQKHYPSNREPILKNQSSRDSPEYANSSETGAHIATEGNTSTELEEYNILIRSMLDEIESCKSKLEKNRHSRIKNGVLNIHSGEIMRFQIEHGSSIHIDHSLFAEQKSEGALKARVTSHSRTHQSTMVEVDSYASDSSKTDLSIHDRNDRSSRMYHSPTRPRWRSPYNNKVEDNEQAQNFEKTQRIENNSKPRPVHVDFDSDEKEGQASQARVAGNVSRKPSPYHRDYELVMDQRMLEKSDSHRDTELWKHQQEIERLERELNKAHEKSSPPREVVRLPRSRESRLLHDEGKWHEDEISERLRCLDRSKYTSGPEEERKQVEHRWRLEKSEEVEKTRRKPKRTPSRYIVRERTLDHEHIQQNEKKRRHSSTDDSRDYRNHSPSRHFRDSSRSNRSYRTDQLPEDQNLSSIDYKDYGYQARYSRISAKTNDQERASENEPQDCLTIPDTAPQESVMFRRQGDDVHKQTFAEGLSLPGNLEDLLAQWTTLSKQEIRREQLLAL